MKNPAFDGRVFCLAVGVLLLQTPPCRLAPTTQVALFPVQVLLYARQGELLRHEILQNLQRYPEIGRIVTVCYIAENESF
jgi:hypothetical protein